MSTSAIASSDKIQTALTNLGIPNGFIAYDTVPLLRQLVVALGNVTTGGGGVTGSGVVTGGGTIATGGFTFTIPATGTAALLGTANSFTIGQTIAPSSAATCLTLTGGTVTTSNPLISATQTWNAGGVTFVGFDHTFTKTAAATGSLMARWSTGSRGSVAFEEGGEILIGSLGNVGVRSGNPPAVCGPTGGNLHVGCVNGGVYLGNIGTFGGDVSINGLGALMKMRSGLSLCWSADNTSYGTTDLILVRKAAATLQIGADAAGVTNQMFTAANRITSDGVGANLTIAAGNGRGAAGGTLILSTFDTAGAGTAGTLRSRMTFDTAGAVAFPVVTAVTTETVVSDTTWPVTINGVAYKILLKA